MEENRIQRIEGYVQSRMGKPLVPDLMVAHDFKHVDRVRGWALRIARGEGYGALEVVEAAALLHDVGLPYVEQRSQHAAVGAEIAARFLLEENLFGGAEIEEIAEAIRLHSSLADGSELLYILRDADMLDLFGAVGIMRALTSKYMKPEYDPDHVKGDSWGMDASDFTQRFVEGIGIGRYIVDQINFQISCFDNLRTETAKQIARPLIDFMKTYMVQLDFEVNQLRGYRETPHKASDHESRGLLGTQAWR
ncbi:MAG: HD domain-containing protein [Ardenticatenaceae bacterium]